MHTKLAGHLPLQDMVAQRLESAREKLAASEGKKEELKLCSECHKHPCICSEKKASYSIDPTDPSEVEKLASALEYIGDMVKEADSIELGGEKTQGGTVLPTMSPVSGKQPYKSDKAHNRVVVSQKLMATKDNKGPANAVPTDDNRAPGGTGAHYPTSGVLKTAAEGVMDKIRAAKEKHEKGETPAEEKKEEGKKESKEESKEEKEKKAASVQYLLNKMAESPQGGLTLDSKSGEGPKPPTGGTNSARFMIESNKAPVAATKREAKAPQKKLLKEVLTEPAMSAATDSKVNENLRNASKGGVKIAAARAFINKIAEDPNDPRHDLLMKTMAKKKSEKAQSAETPATDEAPTAQ